jgi:hypothetical protein
VGVFCPYFKFMGDGLVVKPHSLSANVVTQSSIFLILNPSAPKRTQCWEKKCYVQRS